MKNSTKKGFTIVELVIVIAVIAILAAVLIPTFTSVTANAKESAAMQEAKSDLSIVLAATNGTLTENTYFAIDNNKDNAPDFGFVYKEGKLQAAKEDTDVPRIFDDTTDYYTVYVSTKAFTGTDFNAAQNLKAAIATLLAKSINKAAAAASDNVAVTAVDGQYYSATINTISYHIYYNSDISASSVIFVAPNTAAAVTTTTTAA